jgi:hypothetical protein
MDLAKIKPMMKLVVTREIVGVAEKNTEVTAEENKNEKGTLIIGTTGMVMCNVGLGKCWFFKAEDLEPSE